MNQLNSKMKKEFVLQAVRQILCIFDLDLCLEGHSGDLEPLLLFVHHKKSYCAKYEHHPSKMKKEFVFGAFKTNFKYI